MSWTKWLKIREAVDSQSQINSIVQDVNSTIDNAFKLIYNSILKTYGNRTSIPAGVRDTLIADLQSLIKKISGLQPAAVKECCDYVQYVVINEVDGVEQLLGVKGRDVGGTQKYPMQDVLNSLRDMVKKRVNDAIGKITDIKVSGAVGDIGSQVGDIGSTMKNRFSNIDKGISAIQRGPDAAIPHGSEAEHTAKDNLSRLIMFAQDQFDGKMTIHPGTERGQDLTHRVDPRDMGSIDKLWHLVQPSRVVKIRFQAPGKKSPEERNIDITNPVDVERKLGEIQSMHNMPGANYGQPAQTPGMRLAK